MRFACALRRHDLGDRAACRPSRRLEKVQAKPARWQTDRGRRVCRAEQGRSHGGAATDRNPVVAAVEAVIYGL